VHRDGRVTVDLVGILVESICVVKDRCFQRSASFVSLHASIPTNPQIGAFSCESLL
jgi:hypothetical protein